MQVFLDAALSVGLLVAIVIFTFARKAKRNNIFLGLSLLSIWLIVLAMSLNTTGAIVRFPHFYRTGIIGAYLILPFLVVFIRNTFYPGGWIYRKDLLFFLPALFYIIDLLPFFLSSGSAKLAAIEQAQQDPLKIIKVAEGWLTPPGFHPLFRNVFDIGIWVYLMRMLIRNRRIETDPTVRHNEPMLRFLLIYALMPILSLSIGLTGALFNTSWYTLENMTLVTTTYLLFSSLYILFNPRVLYGFYPAIDRPLVRPSKPEPLSGGDGVSETNRQLVSASGPEPLPAILKDIPVQEENHEPDELLQRVESYMATEKPYLKPRYTIHDLSLDLSVPVYQLSPLINHYYDKNFNNWLNGYRVKHFIGLVAESKHLEQTLDSLSRDAGFSSRAAFINAFRKETDMTPGAYIRDFDQKQTAVNG